MRLKNEKHKILLVILILCTSFSLSGCIKLDGVIPLSAKQIRKKVIATMNEKYPDHTFSIEGDNGTKFALEDENGLPE